MKLPKTAYVVAGAVWVVATGVFLSLGGMADLGFPGFLAYLGVCVLGGTLSGRFM